MRAYVPETWTGYSATVELNVAGAGRRSATLRPGLNVVELPAPAGFPALVRLRCAETIQASRFDPANRDTRPLCFVLQEIGAGETQSSTIKPRQQP
jgi:hypothetical protein